MSFIAKNPILAAEAKTSPPLPKNGTRGLFPMEDGWYDYDENGETKRLATSDEVNEIADDLITDDPNKALSAKQGKLLNENKVDKVDGKTLSSNDFTDELKSKLENIDENATEYTHPETHPADMITGLADVAQSGSYNDLTDTPEIPVVDTELDETSSNAISNSVVATKFNEEIGDINSALEEIITLQEELLIPDGNEVAY